MDPLLSFDDYLFLLLQGAKGSYEHLLSVFFLTLARLLPLFIIVPFLGAKNLPMTIRMLFSLSLVTLFLPLNLAASRVQIHFNSLWMFLMIKESLIGFVMAFLGAAPFLVAQMSGSLIDHQRGSSSLQVNDPTTQSQTGPLGILYNYILLAIFFAVGGPLLYFQAIGTSYELFPSTSFFHPSFFQLQTPFWKEILSLIQHMFNLCIQLGAPALVGILITDMFLGIANRLAPQVQIVFLGMPLKSWVGLALLTAGWALIFRTFAKEVTAWMHLIQRWIELTPPYISF
jgi:type III secretion protein SpaR/YscT/HrcT